MSQQIADELKKRGYEVVTGVGRSQFKVDIAVCDKNLPGVYRLGLLLDGDGYHDTVTTRDREVVQPSVLASLNWHTMRIWSVDWFNNKERVISRIEERLAGLDKSDGETSESSSALAFDLSQEQEVEAKNNACKYTAYQGEGYVPVDCVTRRLVENILTVEQPVNFTLLCRRVCALNGWSRVSPTIQSMVKEQLPAFYKDEYGDFWASEGNSSGYCRYRPNSGRDISEIPMIEVVNTIIETLREEIALNEDNLTMTASKKLGFTRRGANVDAAYRYAVKSLKSRGIIEVAGDNLRLAQQE